MGHHTKSRDFRVMTENPKTCTMSKSLRALTEVPIDF